MTTQLEQAWELAKQRFAAVGIDVEEALRQLDRLPVSMHCWQGDDVAGFEIDVERRVGKAKLTLLRLS